MAEVWTLHLSSGQRDVLLVMADHANDDGICWPSVPLIAWKTDKDVRSVQRILRDLETAGVITCIANESGGRGRSRVYHLHLEKGDKKSPFVSDPLEREEIARLTSGNTDVEVTQIAKGGELSPIPERVTTARVNGDAGARKGDTAMSPEPPKNHQEPPSSPTGAENNGARNTGKETYEILTLVLRSGRKYPQRFKGHLAREIRNHLDEGFKYHIVLEAAKRLEAKGQNPGSLASFVNEVENGGGIGSRPQHRPFNPDDHDYEATQVR